MRNNFFSHSIGERTTTPIIFMHMPSVKMRELAPKNLVQLNQTLSHEVILVKRVKGLATKTKLICSSSDAASSIKNSYDKITFCMFQNSHNHKVDEQFEYFC